MTLVCDGRVAGDFPTAGTVGIDLAALLNALEVTVYRKDRFFRHFRSDPWRAAFRSGSGRESRREVASLKTWAGRDLNFWTAGSVPLSSGLSEFPAQGILGPEG